MSCLLFLSLILSQFLAGFWVPFDKFSQLNVVVVVVVVVDDDDSDNDDDDDDDDNDDDDDDEEIV